MLVPALGLAIVAAAYMVIHHAYAQAKAPCLRPFSHGSTYVRLLARPNVKSSHSCCCQALTYTTIQVPITELDHMKYAALSYTWSVPPKVGTTHNASRQISLDGTFLPVQENLWDFLSSQACAATWEGCGLLFIDAICIDQSSPSQREQQLPLLPTIYAKAAQTIVWLGRQELVRQPRASSLKRRTTGLGGADPQVLQHLACNPYWTRLFVLPEFILAGNILLCIGDEVIKWGDLEDSDTLSQLLRHLNTAKHAHQPMLNALELKRAWDDERKSLSNTHTGQQQGFLLYDALRIASPLKCKNDRDKINAILPLTRNCPIVADYGNTRADFDLCGEVLQFALIELHEEGRCEEEVREAAEFLLGFCRTLLSGDNQKWAAQLVRQLLFSLYSWKDGPVEKL